MTHDYIFYTCFQGCVVAANVVNNLTLEDVEQYAKNHHCRIVVMRESYLYYEVFMKPVDYEVPQFVPFEK